MLKVFGYIDSVNHKINHTKMNGIKQTTVMTYVHILVVQ